MSKKEAAHFTHPELFKLLQEKQINAMDLCLCTMIDQMVGKKGCYARTRYFAEILGIDMRTCRSSLQKLVKLGLVSIIEIRGNNRRYMETMWHPVRKKKRKTPGPTKSSDPLLRADVYTLPYNIPTGYHKNISMAYPHKGGFGLQEKCMSKNEIDAFDIDITNKLHEALKTYCPRRLRRGYRITAWPSNVRKLRKEYDQDTILKVVDWLCKENTIGDKFTPTIASTKSLLEKFDRLVEAMQRGDAPKIEYLEPTDKSKKLAKTLSIKCNFPPAIIEQLPSLIETTDKTLRDIRTKLHAIKEREWESQKERRVQLLANHLLKEFPSPETWWIRMSDSYGTSDRWRKGERYIPTLDQKDFRELLTEIASNYGNPISLETILTEMEA